MAPAEDGKMGMQLCLARRPHCTDPWQDCGQPWGSGRGEATGQSWTGGMDSEGRNGAPLPHPTSPEGLPGVPFRLPPLLLNRGPPVPALFRLHKQHGRADPPAPQLSRRLPTWKGATQSRVIQGNKKVVLQPHGLTALRTPPRQLRRM